MIPHLCGAVKSTGFERVENKLRTSSSLNLTRIWEADGHWRPGPVLIICIEMVRIFVKFAWRLWTNDNCPIFFNTSNDHYLELYMD